MRRYLSKSLVAGAILAVACFTVPLLSRAEEPANEVQQRMLADLKRLSSDELEGRGIGTDGIKLAAELIQAKFAEAGLNVVEAGGDPFQEFEVVDGAEIGTDNQLEFIGPQGEQVTLEYGLDVQACSFGAPGKISGELVFCGYGIDSKEPAYNDFDGIDVKGKVLVVLRRTPQQGQEAGLFSDPHGMSRHAGLRTKVSNAFQRGAAALLLVNDPFTGRHDYEQLTEQLTKARDEVIEQAGRVVGANPHDTVEPLKDLADALDRLHKTEAVVAEHQGDALLEFGYAGTKTGKSLPVMHITQAACNRLLEASLGKLLVEIEAEIDKSSQPHSAILTGWQALGQVDFKLKELEVANVIGVLEGEGPHKEETIVIGAHYDHLGFGGDGSLTPGVHEVHNGADDNASGTTALLELARRFGTSKQKPKRRLVFIAFTGEERGLLGSAEYVKQPLFPLEKTVAMFNMDMVGRLEDDKLTVFGTGTASVWVPLLEKLALPQKLEVVKKPEGFGPSDHSSFYARKIPVLHLFTGTHNDYHRPSDDWEKVNLDGMERIVNLLEGIVSDTASQEKPPEYIAIEQRATLTRSGNRPYFGSIPDFGTDDEGYAIQGVAPGSPAEGGGVKAGDVIIRLGEQAIGSLDDFDLALRKFSPGQEVTVVVRRGGKEVKLRVVLAAPKS